MTISPYTRDFARSGGYAGDSPAMLAAIEEIRQHGLREARKAHADLFKVVERYKATPALFFAWIHPAFSTDEAIDDAKRFLAVCKRAPRRDRGVAFSFKVRKAHETILLARYFRRFGERIWARKAA